MTHLKVTPPAEPGQPHSTKVLRGDAINVVTRQRLEKLGYQFDLATEEEGAAYEARLKAEVQEQEGK